MIRLCALDEIVEGQALGFTLKGRRLIVIRWQGVVHLYQNRCPHRGIPLDWVPDQFLDTSGKLLQCATHGALFLIDSGECIAGPCAGQRLRPIPWTQQQDGVWLQNETLRDL